MFFFNISQKMVDIYKLKRDTKIPEVDGKQYPLWNWYVKPITINRKRYILFLERDNYLCVWADGVNSKNMEEVFKERLIDVLLDVGIPRKRVDELNIEKREIFFSKTSDKVWIGVSTDICRCSEYIFEEIENSPSGLKNLFLYKPNKLMYGGPNYKTPEEEVRKFLV